MYNSHYMVSTMYKFIQLNNVKEMKLPILHYMNNNNILGTLLLSEEGINGSIAGHQYNVLNFINFLKQYDTLANIDQYCKYSFNKFKPFYRAKVKIKKELVNLGLTHLYTNKNNINTNFIKPTKWNKLISDDNTLVIDVRNDYEFSIGTFKNAISTNINKFRQIYHYINNKLLEKKRKNIAIFCTGGIRCEKLNIVFKSLGFVNIYQLEGGILKYLEEIPKNKSLWHGECFVFDSRVSVNHDLQKGQYSQCYACRRPISQFDKSRKEYLKGISCHHCKPHNNVKSINRFIEREKQIKIYHIRKEKNRFTIDH